MSIDSNFVNLLIIILVSIICGFVMGFERELHHKPAGLKTVTLVILGSAIFTFVSKNAFSNADDSRIAAQIVSGIGFLGAGVILRSEFKIVGLTTAAMLWVASSVGLLIGVNYFHYALISSLAVIFVINLFRIFENKIANKYNSIDFTIFLNQDNDISLITKLAYKNFVKVEKIDFLDEKTLKLRIYFDSATFFSDFIKDLDKMNIKYSL